MDCVFGEVKSVMINGVSYDELFGVDINLLNREQREEFINVYLSVNENRLKNLELCIEEEQQREYKLNIQIEHEYFKLLKEHLYNISEHSKIIYFILTKKRNLLNYQKELIKRFLRALYELSEEDDDKLFEKLDFEQVIDHRIRNENLQYTKPDYYQLLKDMIKTDKTHKLFQYEYAQKLIPRDELLSHQKRYIRYFVKAHQNKHYEARDQYYEDLINMDTFI